MSQGNKKTYMLAGGATIIGLLAIGVVVMSRHSSPVPTPSVQGAIGQRDVYRDSTATAATVDATSNQEFEKLYRVGQFKALADDPRFKELAKDPRFAGLLAHADFQRMVSSPGF